MSVDEDSLQGSHSRRAGVPWWRHRAPDRWCISGQTSWALTLCIFTQRALSLFLLILLNQLGSIYHVKGHCSTGRRQTTYGGISWIKTKLVLSQHDIWGDNPLWAHTVDSTEMNNSRAEQSRPTKQNLRGSTNFQNVIATSRQSAATLSCGYYAHTVD